MYSLKRIIKLIKAITKSVIKVRRFLLLAKKLKDFNDFFFTSSETFFIK